MILDLFRFHPAEAAAMLGRGNAKGYSSSAGPGSEGVIGSCGLHLGRVIALFVFRISVYALFREHLRFFPSRLRPTGQSPSSCVETATRGVAPRSSVSRNDIASNR